MSATTSLNIENIKAVRDAIAAHPTQFDMDTWGAPLGGTMHVLHRCDTVACIGGWANALAAQPVNDRAARDWLGLSAGEAGALFYMYDAEASTDDPRATSSAAVFVLDHLIETGAVDWDYAIERAEAEAGK